VQGSNDPFNEYYSGGTLQTLTADDKIQLDALGFNTMTVSQSIAVAATAAEAVQGGVAIALLGGLPTITDSSSTTLASATIKIANAGGSAVAGDKLFVNGIQNGALGNGVTASWNATTDTLTLTGNASLAVYDTLLSEVTYQDTGTDSSTGSHPVRAVTWSVNDGTTSFNTTSQITIDRAPVASVANVVLSANSTTVAASSLFTKSDSDGDTIATYAFIDSGNGHFVLNGVAQANNQEIDVTAAQLSQLTYQSSGGVDSLQVRVNDGTAWSAWQGFTVTSPVVTTVIESFGATELVQVGSNYYLDSISSGTGPELKISGVAVAAGQYGAWAPIGTEITAGGYDVAWNNASLGLYTLWTTDSSGNHLTDSAPMTGTSYALESLETVFNQDLNGDGVIGPTKTVIQTDGSTSLTEIANQFYALDNSSGVGPTLQFNGAPVVAGQYGAWAPIGAVQTAGGYDVAWHSSSLGLYTYWTTDSSGNHLTDSTPMLGGSYALESLETVFNQDLNGDGVIGPPPITKTVIQTDTGSFGSTSLAEGSNQIYYLDNSSGSGPELQLNGAPVVAGQFGAWTPIGAVQTASGYDVAWENASLGLYTYWTTDSSGNHLTDSAAMSGTSYALESLETVFNQDLNGDGVIGPTKTVIQTDTNAFGSTSLTEVANQFCYLDNSTGSGPELQLNGAPVVAGQFGGWTPIGAVQTASGYDVAWKNVSLGLYTYWTTDSSGNHLTDSAPMTGTSYALESLETVFNQDLNGDGVIGPTKTVIQTDTNSFGSTSLTQLANQFFLDNSSGVGPTLQLNGAPVVAGQFGGWTPIGAVQTASGYDVAWKNASLGLYTYWTTDSNGNHLTDSAGMTGTSLALESLETVFNQDLNGDGVIGLAVDSGTTLNISTPTAGTVTFANNSGTTGQLLLSDAKDFTATIAGFTGNGTLSGSDQIDLSGLNYNSGKFSDSYSNGVLTVSDGTNTDKLDFTGTYSPGNFSFASDGQGGTIIYDPPVTGSGQNGNNDSFVFKAGLGHNPITNFPSAAGDTFGFGSSTGANIVAGAGQVDTKQHNGPFIDDRHSASSHDELQIPFHSMNDERVWAVDASNHDNAAAINLHLANLHAGHFIVG